jgi:hypothetical protein
VKKGNEMDKLVRSSFGKRHLDHVAIAWSGKPGVDSIIGVYDDIGVAMAASNDGQTNLTQVMFDTPGNIGDDGRIWVLVDGAAIFSAHCSASAAVAQRTLYGGQVRSFVLNAGRDCGR